MHIVYVIAPRGGPEAYVKTLIPSLEQQGHRISVVYNSVAPQVKPSFPSSVRVEFAPPGTLHYYLARTAGGYHGWAQRLRAHEFAWAIGRALDWIARSERIDLVEINEGLPISSIRKRWRVIVRAHGSDWTFRHFCRDGDDRNDPWLVRLEARQLAQADATSAISQHLADHISEFCQFPRDRIRVIPYPIDTNLFSARPSGSDSQPATLLTIGRLEKRKGIDNLLQAMSRVWLHSPKLETYLLGSEAGFRWNDLLSLAPDTKRNQLIFPGFVSHEHLPSYYRKATLYVAPTLYETFAYTILEAMACGLPVIASRVGAIPELVDDGVTGLLVPPGDPASLADAIIRLLDDPTRRALMGQRARDKAEAEYSVEKIAALTIAFYQRVLAG